MSDSLRPHESQHTRPPCPSPTPRVHSDAHPSSQWCHPAISSSVSPVSSCPQSLPVSSCPQSLPASEPFPMSQLFAWGGQSTGESAIASFLPKNTQGRSPSECTVCVFKYHNFFSYVFVAGHLGCFHVLVLVNNPVINMGMHRSIFTD